MCTRRALRFHSTVVVRRTSLHGVSGAPCLARVVCRQYLFVEASIDFRVFGRRHWRPAQIAAGIEPIRRSLRPAAHLRHLRAPRGRAGVRRLALHRLEHRDDRPPLRPPRPRQPRACGRAARRACARAGRGRWVDVEPKRRKRALRQRFAALSEKNSPASGRSVDAETRPRRPCRQRKELISRNFVKPSNGLEPSTPSLPCRGVPAAADWLV